MLLITNDMDLLKEIKKFLSNKFEMKNIGEVFFVLGIQILWDYSRSVLWLLQKDYIEMVLKRFGMGGCKPGDTPVAKGNKFSLKQYPKNDF